MQDKITINPFDPDSIDEAIKKLEKRKERIHKCAEKLIQRLTDLGVEKAQELVPVDTGTARSSIIGYLDEAEGVGIISAGGYCKYIEFGTGVKGRDSSHPSEEYKASGKCCKERDTKNHFCRENGSEQNPFWDCCNYK